MWQVSSIQSSQCLLSRHIADVDLVEYIPVTHALAYVTFEQKFELRLLKIADKQHIDPGYKTQSLIRDATNIAGTALLCLLLLDGTI